MKRTTINRTILSSLIAISLSSNAALTEKFNIPAAKPSVQQSSKTTGNQLALAVGIFDPLDEKLVFNKSKGPSIESSKYLIVQFHDGKADSEWLRRQGINVVSYLPSNAYIVSKTKNISDLLKSNDNIRWNGSYMSSYKISPELWGHQQKNMQKLDLMVAFFNDYPKKHINGILRKYLPNVKVENHFFGKSNMVSLSLGNNNLDDVLIKLSQIDVVQFVERVKPQKFLNTEAVSAVQGNVNAVSSATNDSYTPSNTPIWDRGLIGSGQIIGVTDSGLDSNEDWFVHYDNGQTITHIVTEAEATTPPAVGTLYPDRKVIGNFIMPGAEDYDQGGHGTHVMGSVLGDRLEAIGLGPTGSISSPTNPGYDNDDGMAPNAQLLVQDIGGTGEDEDGNPEDALTGQGSSPMWQQAYDAGVRIHSNSYGSTGDGAYSFSDLRVDETLHELEDMLILFAAGNDGSGGANGKNTIGSPANGKNVLSIGAITHGNGSEVVGFSSRGPTDDGRLKPDIMAAGSSIESAANDDENSTTISLPERRTTSGTSMSTPITAGASALMRQYYTDGFYPTGVANPADAHTPTGPLMKATLINGAGTSKGGNKTHHHFDFDYGWGQVFLSNSILFDDSDKQMRVWEVTNPNGLKTGEDIEFKLEVKSNQNLAITLAWYDLPGPFGSSKTLVNDLDLTVQVNGSSYKGNVFSSTAVSGTGGTRDSINTVEQVRIPTPVEGLYTITVKGANIPGNGSLNAIRQGFALVATGNFDNINSSPGNMTDASNLTATMQNENGVALTWEGGDNADYFEVYRTIGTCASADFKKLRFVGNSENGTFTDFRTLNGTNYAYKIRAGQYKGLGPLSDTCAEISSTQACDFLPSFNQSSIVIADNVGDICHNKLQWSAATSNCAASPNIKYNVYRSSDSEFLPSSDNLLTTVTSTSFDDIRAPGEAAYYIVRAEDNSPNGSGPNGGTETSGTSRLRSQAVGEGFTSGAVLEDVDNIAIMNLSYPWQVVSNKSADGELSYKTGEGNGNYPPEQCSSIVTNTISLASDEANPEITYKAQYNLEESWDGVVVEISTDDGNTWQDLPPNGGYPGDFSETTSDPVNACGYASTHGAFSGSNNNTFESFSHSLSAYVGSDVKIRWTLSSDPASEFEGFYLDSIQYPNIESPNACTVNTAADKPQTGFYYDKGRNGHGFVVEPIANTDLYFTIFYTYKDDGTPEWYTSLSTLENNVLNMNLDNDTLLRFTHDFSIDPTGAGNPNSIDTSTGTNKLKIDFNSSNVAGSAACNDGVTRNAESVALANWQLGNQQGEWCVEPLIAQESYPTPDFGGTWWTGVDDDGWGLSLAFAGDTIVVTLYYFDANGQPRWALGTQPGFQVGQEITVGLTEFNGFARNATPTALTSFAAGDVTLTLNSNTGDGSDGTLSVNVSYQGSEGGNWNRTNVPVTIFTESH